MIYKAFSRFSLTLLFFILLFSCSSKSSTADSLSYRDTYIVLAEVNHYSGSYSDITIDYKNSNQLYEMFISLGVPEENFLILKDESVTKGLYNSFDWIDQNVPSDAALFFYAAAHGRFLRNSLHWNVFFPSKWNALPQKRKILIVDSCNAGEFVASFKEEPSSGLTYGVVSADEINWWGVEEEGLPIIGSIWVHYFLEAVHSQEADINSDNFISFTEAHFYSNLKSQEYMRNYVFENPDFLASYHQIGQDPLGKEGYPNAVMYNHLEDDLILAPVK